MNTALLDLDQRYHSGNQPYEGENPTFYEESPLYTEQVDSGSEFYLSNPARSTGALWKYATSGESSISTDIRVSYEHPDYPWLKAVHSYAHISHEPFGYDLVSIDLDDQPVGHYVLAWSWQGYYDCTDVDKFDTEVTP